MPLDCLDFAQNPLLETLGRVEGLLATEQLWCKGRLRDSDGRRCLVGAIEAADGWQQIARIVLRAVREVSGKRYWRIESFNDDPGTTHADVLRVLRCARQHIIAEMAKECDREPWPRKWIQALRSLYTDSRRESDVVPVARCRSSDPQQRPVVREDGKVA